MALIKAVHFYEGRAYCLVLDGDAEEHRHLLAPPDSARASASPG